MTNATSHVRFNRLTGARGTSKTQFSSRTSPFSFWMFFFCNNVTLALLPVLITLQLSTLAMTTTAITTKHTHTQTQRKKSLFHCALASVAKHFFCVCGLLSSLLPFVTCSRHARTHRRKHRKRLRNVKREDSTQEGKRVRCVLRSVASK